WPCNTVALPMLWSYSCDLRSSQLQPLRSRPGSTLFPYTTLFRPAGRGGSSLSRRTTGALSRLDRLRQADDEGRALVRRAFTADRSEEHTSELQSRENLVCRLLLEKKK